ncbi:alpha/beta fold hydrolase [Gordonia humi]|uniref:Pimeloyl-ACP methyl ester carboxylesterase n=1 Tax=Gordonia humi TaxID=686429 RepID=A0A840EUQ0_9ACTN|nr:pimeloyl-ACP methyl ester carboxylesterase [Gordonia humi]
MTEWVLVRGLTREQRHWHDLPIILAELGERVTCIDAPGFGTEHTRRSPSTIREITDDMRDRLPFAHEDRAILGISLGGMVALDWCSRYPYDFSLCAVVNTLARDVFRPKYLTRGALTVLALRRFRSLRGHERAVAQLTVASASVDSEELVRQWVNFHHDAPPTEASVRAQALAGLRFRLPETLPTPLTVVAARGDRLADHRMSQHIAERYEAQMFLHPWAGHDLPVDDPAWLCSVLQAAKGGNR